MIVVMVAYLFIKIYKSVKWWKRSAKYVKNDMKIGDTVYAGVFNNSAIGEVSEILEDRVVLKITVHKSNIYLNEKV